MVISFASKSLRTICEDATRSDEQLGIDVARTLRNRIADLRAARTLSDLVAGNPKIYISEEGESLELELLDGLKIRLRPNHTDNPVDEAGRIVWNRINRLKIMGIANETERD